MKLLTIWFVLIAMAALPAAEVLDTSSMEVKAKDLFQAGKYKEAIPQFSSLITNQPTNANAYALRGYCYSEIGKQDLAIKDYSEAIRLDRTDKRALNSRAVTYFMTDQIDKAMRKRGQQYPL